MMRRGGVAGGKRPVCHQRPEAPTLDARRSRIEGLCHHGRPHVPERLFFGYKRVQGGFEGVSVGRETAKEEGDVLNKRRKIPPASPAAPLM
jgi:hypothetical protein